mmetsp:Transcript_14192/g.43524  ORF Transcript_14192/g.43524 Transcript_14192/m.43524 type:complete len:215 (-) Transcript_14192:1273-1917(-)
MKLSPAHAPLRSSESILIKYAAAPPSRTNETMVLSRQRFAKAAAEARRVRTSPHSRRRIMSGTCSVSSRRAAASVVKRAMQVAAAPVENSCSPARRFDATNVRGDVVPDPGSWLEPVEVYASWSRLQVICPSLSRNVDASQGGQAVVQLQTSPSRASGTPAHESDDAVATVKKSAKAATPPSTAIRCLEGASNKERLARIAMPASIAAPARAPS